MVLVLVISGFVYGTHKAYYKYTEVKLAASDAEAKAVSAENVVAAAQRGLTQLKGSTNDLREFAKAWDPYVSAVESPQVTEQRIIDTIKDAGVFALSQRFELLERNDATLIKRRLRAHITIEDEYSKALNWMAGVEEAVPIGRVISCRVQRGDAGNDIRLELIIDVPIIAEAMPS
jgi:hypothetical protein